jgi:glycine oxidase
MERPGPRRTAVVGAGIAGCCLAYTLAMRGHEVALFERGSIGAQGASAAPLALLNPNRGRSARASNADREALASTWRLVAELEALGFDPGVNRSGVLRIASSERQSRSWKRLPDVHPLEPANVPTGVHAPFGGILVEEGGWLEPRKLLVALVQAATNHGARVYQGCEVGGLEPFHGCYALATPQGHFKSDIVVLCTGADRHPRLPLPDFEESAGDVIGLHPAPRLPYPVAGAVYAGKLGSTVYVGGNHRPSDCEDATAPAQLKRAASWFLPELEEAGLVSVWTGVRAKMPDHQPVTMELRPGLWFMGCFAGRGFLSAAAVSQRLAQRLG